MGRDFRSSVSLAALMGLFWISIGTSSAGWYQDPGRSYYIDLPNQWPAQAYFDATSGARILAISDPEGSVAVRVRTLPVVPGTRETDVKTGFEQAVIPGAREIGTQPMSLARHRGLESRYEWSPGGTHYSITARYLVAEKFGRYTGFIIWTIVADKAFANQASEASGILNTFSLLRPGSARGISNSLPRSVKGTPESDYLISDLSGLPPQAPIPQTAAAPVEETPQPEPATQAAEPATTVAASADTPATVEEPAAAPAASETPPDPSAASGTPTAAEAPSTDTPAESPSVGTLATTMQNAGEGSPAPAASEPAEAAPTPAVAETPTPSTPNAEPVATDTTDDQAAAVPMETPAADTPAEQTPTQIAALPAAAEEPEKPAGYLPLLATEPDDRPTGPSQCLDATTPDSCGCAIGELRPAMADLEQAYVGASEKADEIQRAARQAQSDSVTTAGGCTKDTYDTAEVLVSGSGQIKDAWIVDRLELLKICTEQSIKEIEAKREKPGNNKTVDKIVDETRMVKYDALLLMAELERLRSSRDSTTALLNDLIAGCSLIHGTR